MHSPLTTPLLLWMIKPQQYSIQNQNTETGTFYGWVGLWCIMSAYVLHLCTALCHQVQKHSPYSTKINWKTGYSCLIRRLLGKPQEDLWQITTLLSESLKGGACFKDKICNAENSALVTGRMKKYEKGSLEWYLFILCNNGCGFLDLRFCLLQLLPEDFLQLGIEGEKLHSTLTELLKTCQQIVFLVSCCVYNSSTAVSYEIPVLRQVSDLLSLQILIISVITKRSLLWPFISG